MIKILCLFCLMLMLTSGFSRAEDRETSIILPNVKVIPGKHCESSAIVNALNYLDYGLSEPVVVGGGGAPSFVFTEGNFPFLGGRSHNMREVFFSGADIKWHINTYPDPSHPWDNLLKLLERGIPVVLRVDMRYLRYLFGGEYGPPYMSFGWHVVCLFGIDTEHNLID